MKTRIVEILSALIILFAIFSCTDDVTKADDLDKTPRVEFSQCTACYECIDDFQCPQDAFIIDEASGKVYIDQNRCISCYDCLNDFECQYDAITRLPDLMAPASPQNITVISDSIGMIEISFFAPGDDSLTGIAYLYELKINDLAGNIFATDFTPTLPQYSGALEFWQIGDLPENDTLSVNITAFDEVGHSSSPAITQVTVKGEYFDLVSPEPITDLTTISTEYTIILQWTAPADPDPRANVSSYAIKSFTEEITDANWDNAQDIVYDLAPQAPGSLEELLLEFTEPSGLLYFAIRSLDAAGNISQLSNNASAEATTDITAPADITDLIAGTPGNTTIPLSWTATGDNGYDGTATAYEIRYAENEITATTWTDAQEYIQNITPHPAGTTENITISGLIPETEYFFAIKAYDEVNNISNISNSASAITEATADTEAPAPVTDLITQVNDPEITINWTATGDDGNIGTASEYSLYYAQQELTEADLETADQIYDLPFPAAAGTEESVTIDFLEAGITWYFALTATDEAANTSQISNNATAIIPLDTTPPAAITDLSTEVIDEVVTLSWTATGDDGNSGTAFSYDLRSHTEPITEQNWLAATSIPTSPPAAAGTPESLNITDLEANITYYFAIKAEDDNDNISGISNVCDAMIIMEIDVTPPAAITNLSVNDGQSSYNNRITINWTAPGDDGNTGTCDSYEIRYRTSPITLNNWDSSSSFNSPPDPGSAGSNESCVVTGLSSGTVYYFAVRAVDEAGNMGEISNSPGGKIVYQIVSSVCNDCSNCIYDCDQNAISDAGPYKVINPDLCEACGDCLPCPRGAIRLWVIGY
ncbi:MAG: fibronectin type III domain-containing protein [Candidatus Cloacimonetes bacterium]|nr:fibronectin type III domain-containing protein [Candidatus Cloacimonadota bacterium]